VSIMMAVVGGGGGAGTDISSFTVTAGARVIGYKTQREGYEFGQIGSVSQNAFLLRNGTTAVLNDSNIYGSAKVCTDTYTATSFELQFLVAEGATQPTYSVNDLFVVLRVNNTTKGVSTDMPLSDFSFTKNSGGSLGANDGFNFYRLSNTNVTQDSDLDGDGSTDQESGLIADGDTVVVTLRNSL